MYVPDPSPVGAGDPTGLSAPSASSEQCSFSVSSDSSQKTKQSYRAGVAANVTIGQSSVAQSSCPAAQSSTDDEISLPPRKGGFTALTEKNQPVRGRRTMTLRSLRSGSASGASSANKDKNVPCTPEVSHRGTPRRYERGAESRKGSDRERERSRTPEDESPSKVGRRALPLAASLPPATRPHHGGPTNVGHDLVEAARRLEVLST